MINRPLQRGFEKYLFNQGKRYATKEYCLKKTRLVIKVAAGKMPFVMLSTSGIN
jgi:hypothetical protein